MYSKQKLKNNTSKYAKAFAKTKYHKHCILLGLEKNFFNENKEHSDTDKRKYYESISLGLQVSHLELISASRVTH